MGLALIPEFATQCVTNPPRNFCLHTEAMNPIAIYQSPTGTVDVRLDGDTVWLSLQQIADLFGRDKSVISRHLRNVFNEGELERPSVVAKNATTAADGKTYQVEFFNLDAILSVGYRVNSREGTRFRQWATRLLREHLTLGYTVNRQRFEDNAAELEAALNLIRKAAQTPELSADTGRGLVDIVTRYAHTFLWLQRYDEGLLTDPATQPGGTLPTLEQAREALASLKADLVLRGEATDLFARDRGDGLAALLGNLDQSVFGEPAYPSVEAKAAQCQRPPRHQRHGLGRAGPAGGRVRPGAKRRAHPPHRQHAGAGRGGVMRWA